MHETDLDALAESLCDHDAVEDAWLAKSFTDLLLVVDIEPGETLPADVEERLAERGLRGANEMYGIEADERSLVGTVEGVNRHQFVHVETRGDHQSYVVE